MEIVNIPASKIAKGATLTVTIEGMAVLRFRIWVGTLLLKLAAKVIGGNLEILNDPKHPQDVDWRKIVRDFVIPELRRSGIK